MPKAAPPAKASKSKLPPLKVGCVYYLIDDMQRAIDFYTGVLGLKLVVRHGDDWAEVMAGSVRIGLHPRRGAPVVAKPGEAGATVSFYVDDMDAVVAELRRRGAQVDDVSKTPLGKMTLIHDGQGNGLHMSEFDKGWLKRTKYPLPKL